MTCVRAPTATNCCHMGKRLTDSVVKAVNGAPCSLRALARKAGVPPSTLSRIVSGEREATLDVAAAVADALERWAGDCGTLAHGIRQAARTERKRGRTR